MKILLVLDNLGSGGAQRLFAHLAFELIRLGHRVDVFVYDKHDFYEKDFVNAGVRIIRAFRKGRGFSFSVLSSLIVVGKNDYDHIFAALHAPSFYAALAKLFVLQMKLTVCEFSSSNSKTSRMRKIGFYFSTLLADTVICNSICESRLIKVKPGRSGKVAAIWNGYKIDEFHYTPPIPKSYLTLLVVGRVAYPKNGDTLFHALKLFDQRHGWCPRLVWAGRRDFDKKSVKMYDEMMRVIESSPSLKSAIEFLGEVSDIEFLFNSGDVLMHMSLYEGLPNVICEAMLYGCPVIASAVCDHPIILGENGERGLLADPNSAASIADCIEVFNNTTQAEREIISSNARKFAVENFDITRMASAYLQANIRSKD